MQDRPIFLLVDDDLHDREFAECAFHNKNVILTKVTNGLEAKQYMEGEGRFAKRTVYPVPHVILLDLKMPLMDGLEFLQWLRSHDQFKLMPVIVMSSSDCQQD